MAELLLDVVICINKSGSSSIIDELNEKAESFYDIFEEVAESTGMAFGYPRIKILEYGNSESDRDTIKESPFFLLPEQEQAFESYVQAISPSNNYHSGNVFEAIFTAFHSDWRNNQKSKNSSDKCRNIIVVLDDSNSLSAATGPENTRTLFGELKTIDEMIALLDTTINPRNYSLLLFVPQNKHFEKIEMLKECTMAYLHNSLDEVDIETVVDLIVWNH